MTARPKIVVNPPSDPVHPVPTGMLDAVHYGDCVSHLKSLPEACVQLAFADPPFNIGYDYDVYDDSLESAKYLSWCKSWISELYRVLIPTGTFWLAIGDEYAAELKILSQQTGFHCRSWVVWYYTFGVNCKSKFTRSHAHLFHFVKDPNRFTFHADAVAVPSARQLVYADARANPKGRIPDDTWILRPQDCFDGLRPNEDTWYFPRVSGTFKERAGFHGCQMPEQLLGRIIRCCSNPDDVVLDPFSGSATTLAVAKKLGRHFLGFDLSQEYVALGTERLARIAVGQPLEGSEDPKASAPATHQGKQLGEKPTAKNRSKPKAAKERLPLFDLVPDQEELLLEAFETSHRGASVDRLVVDPILNEDFQRACDRLKIEGTPEHRNRSLLRLRKLGRFLHFDFDLEQIVAPKWSELDLYVFSSEIAWRRVADRYAVDLVELFCDVRLASQFDALAARYSPGFTPLEYRWGALMLQEAIRSVPSFDAERDWDTEIGLEGWESAQVIHLASDWPQSFPDSPAIYSLEDLATEQVLYVGETANLKIRIDRQFGDGRLNTLYDTSLERASIRFRTIPSEPSRNQWRRARLLDRFSTTWNV
jgi:DNA modification methylase